MKSLFASLVLLVCLSACSRQPFGTEDTEQAAPSNRHIGYRTFQEDTVGNTAQFRVYWKAKEDSIKRVYSNL